MTGMQHVIAFLFMRSVICLSAHPVKSVGFFVVLVCFVNPNIVQRWMDVAGRTSGAPLEGVVIERVCWLFGQGKAQGGLIAN